MVVSETEQSWLAPECAFDDPIPWCVPRTPLPTAHVARYTTSVCESWTVQPPRPSLFCTVRLLWDLLVVVGAVTCGTCPPPLLAWPSAHHSSLWCALVLGCDSVICGREGGLGSGSRCYGGRQALPPLVCPSHSLRLGLGAFPDTRMLAGPVVSVSGLCPVPTPLV